MSVEVIALNQKKFGKLVSSSLAIALFTGIITQGFITINPILAYESNMIKNSVVASNLQSERTMRLNEELRLKADNEKWNAKIREKYKNGRILTVSQGIKHIQLVKYINSRPIKINVVEVNRALNENINVEPVLSYGKLRGKESIRNLAKRNNSLVAINGTFFKPQSGIPLGTLMIDGKILTGPVYNRVAMGIGKNDYKMARVEFNGKIIAKGAVLRLDNINQPRMLSTHAIAYTSDWAEYSPATPKYGKQMVIEDNIITQITDQPVKIPFNGYVIIAPARVIEPFSLGQNVNIDIKTNPNWQDVDHIISGGPYLIKNGLIFIDTGAEKLNSIGGKNPRTAIGYTADNELIIVTIDGREESSVGMTLSELASFMKGLGCVNAMNLDGGGSSVMYVNGNIVNQPSIKGGIPLSNAFTIGLNEQIAMTEEEE